jgi:N-ethylmaleimide reductase
MSDSAPKETFAALVEKLNAFGLSYLHVMEPYMPPGSKHTTPERYLQDREVTPYFRKIYNGVLMTNSGYSVEEGKQIVEDGFADIVAFGKLFISNPDLVRRMKEDLPTTDWDFKTFYGGDDRGYIDYPFYDEQNH